ncbi:MAG: PorT family protein [Chlorobi bacterium]|nr:PorT family protein [Chlorobiota bacterium]
MKKFIYLFITFSLLFQYADAQRRKQTIKWFSIAAKVGYGNSVLLNVNNIEDKHVEFNYLTPSLSYGGRFTFTYGNKIGFGIDVLFSNFGQNYTIDNNSDIYDKNLKIKSLDILPFFRYSGEKGGYLEIGPKFSNVKSLTITNSISNPNPPFKSTDNIAANYAPKFTSLVLGFGLAVYKNERFDVNLGTRFAYSFTDFTPGYSYNVVDDGYYIPSEEILTPTNPLSIQLILEVNYYFAFYGDATCGKGRLMLFK